MPLMPILPMPMKCTLRFFRHESADPASLRVTFLRHRDQRQRPIDVSRGVRLCERAAPAT